MTDASVIDEFEDNMSNLIDDSEDINDLLQLWSEMNNAKKKVEVLENRIKDKVRAYLKERFWDSYIDKKTQIKVSISTMKRESLDKEMLNMMLTPAQIASITKISTTEQMRITTKDTRTRMSKYAKTGK